MVLAPLDRVAGGNLTRLLEGWAHAYADSKAIATLVTFGHIASLLMAGGLALATDRATLRALRLEVAERGRHLDELTSVHRFVVTGLAVSAITGALLFASDVETFLGSPLFWGKMALVLALLVNGFLMTRAERAAREDGVGSLRPWTHLRRTALVSVGLWYAITLVGVALVNIA